MSAARADGDNHALGLAVVHKASRPIFDALAGTKMELGQTNADGFTALHAAAEVDHPTIVPAHIRSVPRSASTSPGWVDARVMQLGAGSRSR